MPAASSAARLAQALAVLVSLLLPASLGAQTPRLYNLRQGLTSTRINSLSTDRDGFLWVSTEMGLLQFNGQAFTPYIEEAAHPYSLKTQLVNMLYEDAVGRHWVGTNAGLYYFCRTENKFTRFSMLPDSSLQSISAVVTHPTRPGSVIVGTQGWGIYLFDGVTKRCDFQQSLPLTDLLGDDRNVQRLLVDSRGRLWVLGTNGVRVIDVDGVQCVPFANAATDPLVAAMRSGLRPLSIAEADGVVYIGTSQQGLIACDLETMRLRRMDQPRLTGVSVMALCADSASLLVGTEGHGLYRYAWAGDRLDEVQVPGCPVDLARAKIHDIIFDNQHNLWLAVYQRGLLVLPHSDGLFACHSVSAVPGGANLGPVTSFAQLADSTCLVGMDGGGVMVFRPGGVRQQLLPEMPVLALAQCDAASAYIGTYGSGVYVYANGTVQRDEALAALDQKPIMSLVNEDGVLYIGTNGDGVYRLKAGGTLEHLDSEVYGYNPWIITVQPYGDMLWVATAGGLYCVNLPMQTSQRRDLKTGRTLHVYDITTLDDAVWMASEAGLIRADTTSFTLLRNKDARVGEELYSIRAAEGALWYATSYGIGCYDFRHRHFISYEGEEVLMAGSFSHGAMGRWPDGRIVVGGDDGMLAFDPVAVSCHRPALKDVFFTSLWVDNVPVNFDPTRTDNVLDGALWQASTLTLPADAASFAISFAVQEYTSPQDFRYSYRLLGYEDDWHDAPTAGTATATYTRLPSGSYRLQVRAYTMQNRNLSTYKELRVVVLTPWYADWWVYALGILLIFGILFLLARRVVRS